MKQQADKERRKTNEWKKGDNIEYERFSVQGKTGKEISEPIYWSIYY